MKEFGGPVLFVDRDDVNTDEIIPAKYLTEVDKRALGPHLLEDLLLEGFELTPATRERAGVIVTRANFGCGSSREHAPWALEANGINLVVAESYARIFRQNMFNGGLLAVELPPDRIRAIFDLRPSQVHCAVDLALRELSFRAADGREERTRFGLNPFAAALVEAGGWVGYADARY